MTTLDQFIAQNTGRCMDLDNAWGCQCRDLVNGWARALGKPDVPGPNAIDMWSHAQAQGFQKMASGGGTPQPGDILVWDRSVGPYGHTAIFVRAEGGGFYSFDQNWPEGSDYGSPAKQVWHGWGGVLGWFRPIGYGTAPEEEDLNSTQDAKLNDIWNWMKGTGNTMAGRVQAVEGKANAAYDWMAGTGNTMAGRIKRMEEEIEKLKKG